MPSLPLPTLTVRAIKTVPVEVPLTFVLGTSREALTRASLLLIDLATEEGVTGRSYLWCYMREAMPAIDSMLRAVEAVAKGERLAPVDLWAKLSRRFALMGVQGIVRMAMAGFDIACWDALALAANMPLAQLLGATPRPIPAYNSCGLGLMQDKSALADEAEKLLARGFAAVKLRLGYAALAEDITAIHAVRKRIGEKAHLMVDYNQALTLAQAMERGRALDAEKVYWLEEPIRHDNYAGAAKLAQTLATPIQIGENFSEAEAMETALTQGAADYVMPDLERIGGVTGWQRAAALAAVHRIEMSSHLYPEVSAHLLAATPTCHFLEYVDWADAVLEEPLAIANGQALVPSCPGSGIRWNKDAIARFRVS